MSAHIEQACRNCAGNEWVCENHLDRPWDGTSADPAACGCGAGAPCPVCSPEMANAGLLTVKQGLVDALNGLLGPSDDPHIGWQSGLGKKGSAFFCCEFCHVEDLDTVKMVHADSCPIPKARAAISLAPGETPR